MMQLPNILLIDTRFDLTVLDGSAPTFLLGSELRGAIAWWLKQSVCFHPEHKYCRNCALLHQCIYPAVFEPAPPPDSEVLRTHQNVPLPIVIKLAPNQAPQGSDRLSFGLCLIGRAARYLPYIIAAVEMLGEQGLGKRRLRLRVDEVHRRAPADTAYTVPIYAEGEMVGARHEPVTVDLPSTESCHDMLRVRFLTPTRLKHAREFMHDVPAFHVLIRALMRRVSSLSYFHHGISWKVNYAEWIERAEAVVTAESTVKWVDQRRFSNRQQQSISLGGLVGEVTYRGDMTPYVPLLRLGEIVHVGKGTVFGNGQFAVEIDGV